MYVRDGHLAKNSDSRSGPPPKSFILIPLTKNKYQKSSKKKILWEIGPKVAVSMTKNGNFHRLLNQI